MIADGDFIGPWPEGASGARKLVFIGRNLNRPQLRRGFEACQVAGLSMGGVATPTIAADAIAAPAHELGAFVVAAAFCAAARRRSRSATARCAWRRPTASGAAVEAHDGAILAMAADGRGGWVTGGDDGAFRRIDAGGDGRRDRPLRLEMGRAGGGVRATARRALLACAVGKAVHVFDAAARS